MTNGGDRFDLERFVLAQDLDRAYECALVELKRGRKISHWMWFVFPQHVSLGLSPTANRYGVTSLDEARAYLRHPVLGPRLIECATALTVLENSSAEEVLGLVDAKKLRSSMTLFSVAAPDEPIYRQVLDLYFAGVPDPRTLELS